MYDFDEIIERRGTNSLKYDFAAERGRPADALPLWVADMDIRAPRPVIDALVETARRGIYGYSEVKEEYAKSVTGWFDRRFGWKPDTAWLVKTPGVVFALAHIVRAFTEKGDGVLIQTPVYYPFFEVIEDNDRRVVESELVLRGGRYQIDFDDFERKIVDENVKLFLLCSPHNPTCRVWSAEELTRMGQICHRHGVLVASDEIHCDLVRQGFEHIPYLKANPSLADECIICTAPTKAFNMAGLQVSNNFIPNEARRSAFRKEIDKSGYSQHNTFGLVAAKTAYDAGAEWLNELLPYLEGNLDILREAAARIEGARLIEPEGTYFAWIDFRDRGLSDEQIGQIITDKAKLWLDPGPIFGKKAGSGFQRIAYASPHALIREAADRLVHAFEGKSGQS